MNAETCSKMFKTFLSEDEWLQVPSEIATKIEDFIEEKFVEFIKSKALFESRKNDYGKYKF